MNAGHLTRRESLSAMLASSGAIMLPPASASASDQTHPHVTAVTYSPDGQHVVCGSQAGIEVRRADNLELIRRLDASMDAVHDVRFSPDGQWLLVAGGSPAEFGSVAWFRWPDGQRQRQIDVHDDVIHQVAFSSDMAMWITASGDEVCSVFRGHASKPIARFTQHSRAVLSVVLLRDGKTAVSGSRDETLRVWDVESGEAIRTLHNHSRDVTALAHQPSEKGLPLVASASIDLTVRFWQPTIGRMVRFARLPSTPLAICWIAAGKYLVAACDDGKLRVIDPIKVSVIETVTVSNDWLFDVAEDPNQSGRVVVGGSYGVLETSACQATNHIK